ncbi:hypothetical protein [Bacillus phage SWEP1]|nr:hypothetical protein [Bacillus phage SWEP1]
MFNLFVGLVLLWCFITNEYNRREEDRGGVSLSIVLGILCGLNLLAAMAGLFV